MTAAHSDCWVVTDGAAGNERQALALAHALGREPEVLRLQPRVPWRWLAPRLLPGAAHAFGGAFAARLSAPPALAIGCGRRGALALRLLAPHCSTVQILDPRIDPRHFDVVVAPAHDGLTGANVVATTGALNEVDEAWLARARDSMPELDALPRPITLLALGGPTRAVRYGPRWIEHVATVLEHWRARDGGSLLVTGSRRTPDWLQRAARHRLAGLPGRQWHGPADGPNPYAGFLARADRIIVSPDSVNLLSEACATGRPVLTYAPRPPRGRLGALHRALVEGGHLRPLRLEFHAWEPEPLRELARVATRVRAFLARRSDAGL